MSIGSLYQYFSASRRDPERTAHRARIECLDYRAIESQTLLTASRSLEMVEHVGIKEPALSTSHSSATA